MRRNPRAAVALAVAGAGMMLAGVVAAPPAAAATLTASLSCYSMSNWYFECYLTPSGGTAPYTATWSSANAAFSSTSSTYATGICRAGTSDYVSVTVNVTVRDSAGRATTASNSFLCYYQGI
jgi:hypothetical protein